MGWMQHEGTIEALRWNRHRQRLWAGLCILCLCTSTAPGWTLPTGYQVISGDVSIQEEARGVTITSQSDQAIIQYEQFHIGEGEQVHFMLPHANASVLNRVLGPDTSHLLGTLSGNGIIILVNPNGITIGNSAVLQASHLIASTLGLSNTAYLNGSLTQGWSFQGDQPQSILQKGMLQSPDGSINLLAGAIQQTGTIDAPSINLAVGSQATLKIGENQWASVTVDNALKHQIQTISDAIYNSGTLHGEQLNLITHLEQLVYARAINNTGHIQANAIQFDQRGQIRLVAQGPQGHLVNTGTLDTSGNNIHPDGGHIILQATQLEQAGRVRANATSHGTAGNIQLNATEHLMLPEFSVLQARGQGTQSDGGTIRLWSDKTTHLAEGSLVDVRGGDISGNGGFAELSARDTVEFYGTATGKANNGVDGQLLIDPSTIRIRNTGNHTPNGNTVTYDASESNMMAQSFHGFQDVTLEATNDIYVDTPWSLDNVTDGHALTLRAADDIFIRDHLSTQGGDINLFANSDFTYRGGPAASGNGDIYLSSGKQILSYGGNITLLGRKINTQGLIDSGGGYIHIESMGNEKISLSAPVQAGSGEITLIGRDITTLGELSGQSITLEGLSGKGQFQLGSMTATDTLRITNTGHADDKIRFLENSTLTAGQHIDVTANQNIDVYGTLKTSGVDSSMTLTADADQNQAGNLTIRSGGQLIGRNGAIRLQGENVTLDGPVQSEGGDITLQAGRDLKVGSAGSLDSIQGNLTLTSGEDTVLNHRVVTRQGNLSVTAAGYVQTLGTVKANDIQMQSGGTLTHRANTTALGSIQMEASRADSDVAISQGILDAGKSILLKAADNVSVSAPVTAQQSLQLIADSDHSLDGDVLTSRDGTLLTQQGNMEISGHHISVGQSVQAPSGHVDMTATGRITLNGPVQSHSLSAQSNERLQVKQPITTTGDMRFTVHHPTDSFYASAPLTAGGRLTAQSQSHVELRQHVSAQGDITLTADSDGNQTGDLKLNEREMRVESAQGNIAGSGRALTIKHHVAAPQGDISLTGTGGRGYVYGTLDGNTVQVQTAQQLEIRNTIQASQHIGLAATGDQQDVKLNGTTLHSGGTLTVEAGDDIAIKQILDADRHIQLRADADGNGDGKLLQYKPITSTQGNITLQGAQLDINESVQAENGTIQVMPSFDVLMTVGGKYDNADSATRADISKRELERINSAHLHLGDASMGGGLEVLGNIPQHNTLQSLTLTNTDHISSVGHNLATGERTLSAHAGGVVTLSSPTDLSFLTSVSGESVHLTAEQGDIGQIHRPVRVDAQQLFIATPQTAYIEGWPGLTIHAPHVHPLVFTALRRALNRPPTLQTPQDTGILLQPLTRYQSVQPVWFGAVPRLHTEAPMTRLQMASPQTAIPAIPVLPDIKWPKRKAVKH